MGASLTIRQDTEEYPEHGVDWLQQLQWVGVGRRLGRCWEPSEPRSCITTDGRPHAGRRSRSATLLQLNDDGAFCHHGRACTDRGRIFLDPLPGNASALVAATLILADRDRCTTVGRPKQRVAHEPLNGFDEPLHFPLALFYEVKQFLRCGACVRSYHRVHGIPPCFVNKYCKYPPRPASRWYAPSLPRTTSANHQPHQPALTRNDG